MHDATQSRATTSPARWPCSPAPGSGIGKATALTLAGGRGDDRRRRHRRGRGAGDRRGDHRGGRNGARGGDRRDPARRRSTRSSTARRPSSAASTSWATSPGSRTTRWSWTSPTRTSSASSSINLKSCFYGCQAAMRVMAPRGSGNIINISSGAIDTPAPTLACYGMTKAAVAMLTKTLACEAGPLGIRVNALAPGRDPHQLLPPQLRRRGRQRDPGEGRGVQEALRRDGAAEAGRRGPGRRRQHPVPRLRAAPRS